VRRGDVVEIVTVIGRKMKALVLSDVELAETAGYVFIAPVLDDVRSRSHVTAPISAVNGFAILWRMQSVTWQSLADGEFAGHATAVEMAEIDEVLALMLGLKR